MKLFTLTALALCLSLTAISQPTITGKTYKSRPLLKERYANIDESPYLFAEPVKAIAINKEEDIRHEYLLNFNGHQGTFEFEDRGNWFVLDETYYDVIEIADFKPGADYPDSEYASTSMTFVRGLDSENPNDHQIVLFADEELAIYKIFNANHQEYTTNDPYRGLVTNELFIPEFSYYYEKDGKKTEFKLKKKDVLEAISDSQVETFVQKNKLKLKDERELIQVLNYLAEIKVSSDLAAPVVASNQK